jgi:uncharacterized membrane protein YgdD (TMEM256/DUF423 family)
MNARFAAMIGSLFGGLAVVLGAFGAHALRSHLEPRDLETFETAVRYQMYHAFALFAAAWLMSRNAPHAATAAWTLIAGVAIFSGSLYVLVATGQRWLGAVTPIGGLALIAGWVLLALAASKLPQ